MSNPNQLTSKGCGIPNCPICPSSTQAHNHAITGTTTTSSIICLTCGNTWNTCTCSSQAQYNSHTGQYSSVNIPYGSHAHNTSNAYIDPNGLNWNYTYPAAMVINRGRLVHIMEGYEGKNLTDITEAVCSKCKVVKSIQDIAVSYGYLKIGRHICVDCYVKQLDKQYELDNNSELEEALFKK